MEFKSRPLRDAAVRAAPLRTSPVHQAIEPPLAPRARSGAGMQVMLPDDPSTDGEGDDAVVMHVSSRAAPPRLRVDLSPWAVPPAPQGGEVSRLVGHLKALNVKYAPLFDAYCVLYRGQGGARDREHRYAIDSEIARLENVMAAIFKARRETLGRCAAAGCEEADIPPLSRPDFRAPSTWPAPGARVQLRRPAPLDLKLLRKLPDVVQDEEDEPDEPLSRDELLTRLRAVEAAYAPVYREYVQLLWKLEEGEDPAARARSNELRPQAQKCCRDKCRLRLRLQESGLPPWDVPQGLPLLFPGY